VEAIRVFGRKAPTKEVAKSRLKLVLVQDRLNCSNTMMENLRRDILEVISRYMEFDVDDMDIQVTNARVSADGEGTPVLIANIPVRGMRKVQ
jgi:cell division topological specificity factor